MPAKIIDHILMGSQSVLLATCVDVIGNVMGETYIIIIIIMPPKFNNAQCTMSDNRKKGVCIIIGVLSDFLFTTSRLPSSLLLKRNGMEIGGVGKGGGGDDTIRRQWCYVTQHIETK